MSKFVYVTLFVSGMLLGTAAIAQTANDASGPAAGKNVQPSTSIQKGNEGRSADESKTGMEAGAPGIEAKPNTQSGASVKPTGETGGKR